MDRLALMLIVVHQTNSYLLAGLMVATASIVITFAQPIWARAADHYGQGKILYLNTILRFLSFTIFISLVHLGFPIWTWFLSIIFAELNTIGAGGLIRRRWLHVLTDNSLKTTAYSFEALIDEIVFVFGPLIATTLSTYFFPEAGLIASMIFVLIGQPALGSLKDTEPPINTQRTKSKKPILLKRKTTKAIILPILFVGAYFGSVSIAVLAFTNAVNKPGYTGALLAIWALGSGIAAIFNGVIKWKIGHAKLFIFSLNFLLIMSIGLLFTKSVTLLALTLFINGLGISPVLINAYATMEHEVSEDEMTEAMTWVTTGTPTGGAIGSAIAGRIIDKYGYSMGFWVPVIALFIANMALLPYFNEWVRLRSRP